jgi:hypothetical protein
MESKTFQGTYPKPNRDGGTDSRSLTPHLRNGHPRTVYLGPRFFVHGATPMACEACVWGKGEHAEFCEVQRARTRDAAAAAYSMGTAP